jgi:hypothetical protein
MRGRCSEAKKTLPPHLSLDGKEECQVQWAVTWQSVDDAFKEGQLYTEFMEVLNKDSGNEIT